MAHGLVNSWASQSQCPRHIGILRVDKEFAVVSRDSERPRLDIFLKL